jgi:hypothetical protein
MQVVSYIFQLPSDKKIIAHVKHCFALSNLNPYIINDNIYKFDYTHYFLDKIFIPPVVFLQSWSTNSCYQLPAVINLQLFSKKG